VGVKDVKMGKLVANGVVLLPHEYETVAYFLKLGYDIELIPASHTSRMKRADFWMDGVEWESKVPFMNMRRSIERLFYEATQQSGSLVFDLRKIKGSDMDAIRWLESRFSGTRRARNLLIITKDGVLRRCKKR
jgi:hypothetical protein